MHSEDVVTESARTRSTLSDGLDRLMSASADRVFSAPVRDGERMVIPAARVEFSGGFGFGFDGGEPAEHRRGGGGHRTGRPVAVIEAGPEGVRVKPVVDRTRVGLTLFAAGIAVWTASRSRRWR
jgi:uncharacterized spore protein YtfJ